jgi:DDE superfamily endonuclease
MDMLDIYSDYLICQNKYATATGLSAILDGELSHDSITRFLRNNHFNSEDIWKYVKKSVRQQESENGVLILDDSIEEKPYTDENDINCWHYSHAKGDTVKGINILSCMIRYDDFSVPVGYEIIKKDIQYCDLESKKIRRKSNKTKNELFQELLARAVRNSIKFEYVLADNWYGAKANLNYIHFDLKKKFIIGIKTNRTIALSKSDAQKGHFIQLGKLELENDVAREVWLKDISFPITLIKKDFKNENSIGTLYLISNDTQNNADHLYSVYQKRWRIEEYHKSIKQNASLATSPTKTIRTQSNHIYASIVAYCKLELLKFKTKLNHFAIKYKLILKANQLAMKELKFMTE